VKKGAHFSLVYREFQNVTNDFSPPRLFQCSFIAHKILPITDLISNRPQNNERSHEFHSAEFTKSPDITKKIHIFVNTGRCIQKFPDWPPGARTANGTALCHYVQLYRYFVSQSSEFWRHNPLC
jgi:hypothetical protein